MTDAEFLDDALARAWKRIKAGYRIEFSRDDWARLYVIREQIGPWLSRTCLYDTYRWAPGCSHDESFLDTLSSMRQALPKYLASQVKSRLLS